MTKEVTKIKIEDELKVCPNCGYEDGFHSMFDRVGGSEDLSWKLICPNCHKIFDIDLKAKIKG